MGGWHRGGDPGVGVDVFAGPFAAPFSPPVASPGTVAVPWYLAGGVAAANCKAAYAPIGAADLADSYVNEANPGTNNAAPGAAPSWASATGWTFNGTSHYLTTGLTPLTAAWSMIVRFSGAPAIATGDKYMVGAYNSFGQCFILCPGVASFSGDRIYCNVGRVQVAGTLQSGVMCVAGQTNYLNGASEGAAGTAGTATTRSIYIGALNLGSPYGYHPSNILALAVYDVTLTGAQVAAITTAMNALTG